MKSQAVLPVTDLVAAMGIRLTIVVFQSLCSSNPYLRLVLECKNSDAGNSDMPEKFNKVLLLSEKVKVQYNILKGREAGTTFTWTL